MAGKKQFCTRRKRISLVIRPSKFRGTQKYGDDSFNGTFESHCNVPNAVRAPHPPSPTAQLRAQLQKDREAENAKQWKEEAVLLKTQ
jgi:hypothetical protein